MAKFKPQYKRLLFIDRVIREKSFPNCNSMAKEWEVSQKTIQRDIDYLKYELDAPIGYNQARKGYFYTEENYKMPAINVSESDLFAICIAERALKQFEHTPLHSKLQSVFDRIGDSIPSSTTVDPAWIDDRIFFNPEPCAVMDPQIWEKLATALRTNKRLKISHLSPGQTGVTERLVDPYHMIYFKGEWYLSSFCHNRSSIRTFGVSRIKKADVTDESFVMPKEFSRDKMFGDRMGIIWKKESYRVSVQFTPAVAPFIKERKWHPRQVVKDHKDGSLTLSFNTIHLNEVKDWILSYGRNAKVIEPKSLIERISSDLKAAVAQYR